MQCTRNCVIQSLGINIKLHPTVLLLLSLLGRSLGFHVQFGRIEVLVEMSLIRWKFGIGSLRRRKRQMLYY